MENLMDRIEQAKIRIDQRHDFTGDKFITLLTPISSLSCLLNQPRHEWERSLKNAFDELAYCATLTSKSKSRIKSSYENTIVELSGTKFENVKEQLLAIIRSIMDIRYKPFTEEHIGDALARIYLFSKYHNITI